MSKPSHGPEEDFLQWSEEFELGYAASDADHAMLFDAVNRLAAAIAAQSPWETAAALAGDLVEESRRHFAAEESTMRKRGYPLLALHREQHNELLAQIERLRERLAVEHHLAEPHKALRFLRDWFAIHIARSDRNFVDFLKTLPES